jgi:hypothetical protein
MPFVERLFECGTAMSRGAEHNPLLRHGRIRKIGVVGRDEVGDINEH